MPALESSHAVAYGMRAAAKMKKSQVVVIGLSGRGDKDVHTVEQALGDQPTNGHGRNGQGLHGTGGRS
jgi:tryptophan synthase beta subunit